MRSTGNISHVDICNLCSGLYRMNIRIKKLLPRLSTRRSRSTNQNVGMSPSLEYLLCRGGLPENHYRDAPQQRASLTSSQTDWSIALVKWHPCLMIVCCEHPHRPKLGTHHLCCSGRKHPAKCTVQYTAGQTPIASRHCRAVNSIPSTAICSVFHFGFRQNMHIWAYFRKLFGCYDAPLNRMTKVE